MKITNDKILDQLKARAYSQSDKKLIAEFKAIIEKQFNDENEQYNTLLVMQDMIKDKINEIVG